MSHRKEDRLTIALSLALMLSIATTLSVTAFLTFSRNSPIKEHAWCEDEFGRYPCEAVEWGAPDTQERH